MDKKQCRNCKQVIISTADRCGYCGAPNGNEVGKGPLGSGSVTFASVLACVLLLAGIYGVVYYHFYFDPSVAVAGTEPLYMNGVEIYSGTPASRVVNIHKLQHKQNSIYLSSLAALLGLAWVIYEDRRIKKGGK